MPSYYGVRCKTAAAKAAMRKKSSSSRVKLEEIRRLIWLDVGLKNIKDGEIYGWHPILAENPLTVEVTEEEAFPEKFIPKKQKGRKAKVKFDTELPEKSLILPHLSLQKKRHGG